jgi:hypothetical protein
VLAYVFGLVPGLDHAHVCFGAIGGIPAHNDQLGPTRWDTLDLTRLCVLSVCQSCVA